MIIGGDIQCDNCGKVSEGVEERWLVKMIQATGGEITKALCVDCRDGNDTSALNWDETRSILKLALDYQSGGGNNGIN